MNANKCRGCRYYKPPYYLQARTWRDGEKIPARCWYYDRKIKDMSSCPHGGKR